MVLRLLNNRQNNQVRTQNPVKPSKNKHDKELQINYEVPDPQNRPWYMKVSYFMYY